jgi:hypothetical protein
MYSLGLPIFVAATKPSPYILGGGPGAVVASQQEGPGTNPNLIASINDPGGSQNFGQLG